jgi:hypothetical protein
MMMKFKMVLCEVHKGSSPLLAIDDGFIKKFSGRKSFSFAAMRNYFAVKIAFSLSMIAGGCDMTSFTMASRFSPDVGSNS